MSKSVIHLGGVGAPRHQEQLLFFGAIRRSLTLVHVLEIKQTIPTLAGAALLNVLQELVVLCVAIADHLHVDLFFIANIENDVTMLFVLFDFFVCRFTDV